MEDKNINIKIHFDWLVVLTIVFVLLKVFGKITWSWIWVFAPLWLPFAIIAGIGLIIFIGIKIADFFDSSWFWNRIEDTKSWFYWRFKASKEEKKEWKDYLNRVDK